MHILLMYSTHSPSQEHISRLQGIDPSIQVSVADSVENAIKHGRTADIIFGHRYLAQCLPYGAKIRWVQSTAGGVDRLPLFAGFLGLAILLSVLAATWYREGR